LEPSGGHFLGKSGTFKPHPFLELLTGHQVKQNGCENKHVVVSNNIGVIYSSKLPLFQPRLQGKSTRKRNKNNAKNSYKSPRAKAFAKNQAHNLGSCSKIKYMITRAKIHLNRIIMAERSILCTPMAMHKTPLP
jgi:hypothetical protein